MSQLIKGISRTHQNVFKIPRLIDLTKHLELNLKDTWAHSYDIVINL